MFVFESATAGCGILNDSLTGIIHAIKIQSIDSLFVIVAAPETLWQTKRKLYTWLFFILASKFIPHPRISQSDFQVIRFVKRKSTKTKVMDNSNASTCGQANRSTKRQSTRDKRKRKQMESE